MLAHYGVDILDKRCTLRRIHVLKARLPAGVWPDPESDMSWSIESHLLAACLDSLGALVYITLKANGAKNVKQPAPVPRPKPKRRAPAQLSHGENGRKGWAALADVLQGQKDVEVVTVL